MKVKKNPNHGMRARIARELGITGQAVSKLAKLGMPVSSPDAARKWRAENLHPGRVRPDPGPSVETLLQRAAAACELGEAARRAGQLDAVADRVRAALRAVPKSHRQQLAFPFALFAELIGPRTMLALSGPKDDDAGQAIDPAAEGEDDPGEVAYALAADELRFIG